MNRGIAFVELEQKVEQLVNRYSKLKDTNDALKREVGFLRQENQRLLAEQKDIEDKVSRILHRVQMQDDGQQSADTAIADSAVPDSADADGYDDYAADASRYETPGS